MQWKCNSCHKTFDKPLEQKPYTWSEKSKDKDKHIIKVCPNCASINIIKAKEV